MRYFRSFAHYATSQTGHVYGYQVFCQKALQILGKEFIGYTTEESALPEDWVRWFPAQFKRKGRWAFWKKCAALFRQSRDESVFFLEYFEKHDFRLIALAAFFFLRKEDHLWIVFRDDLSCRSERIQKVISFYTKLLQKRLKNRLVLLSDSELLAEFYTDLFKQKVHVLPIPHTHFSNPRLSKETLICAWLGPPREEKGLSNILKILKSEDPISKRFIMRIPENLKERVSHPHLDLRFSKKELTREEYVTSLEESDLVLLPYDPILYRRRTSGIFIEAIAAGKMPIVKEGSWLAVELKRFDLPELVVDWEQPLFFSHLLELYHNDSIKNRLEKMQKIYAQWHTLESFSQKVQELLDSSNIK